MLDAVFAEEVFARSFYLTGGTALAAFYLFHRYSDDLDFFTNDQPLEVVWPTLQRLLPALGLTVESRTPQFIRLRHPEGVRVDGCTMRRFVPASRCGRAPGSSIHWTTSRSTKSPPSKGAWM
jgi:hypothetical protein